MRKWHFQANIALPGQGPWPPQQASSKSGSELNSGRQPQPSSPKPAQTQEPEELPGKIFTPWLASSQAFLPGPPPYPSNDTRILLSAGY